MSVQVQREKRSQTAPSLDANFASRLPLRVLLADDNPINQKVGLSVLQKLGYRAEVANNGAEVMKALAQKPYDILFLDVQMPEMDGLECARQICSRWTRDKRPVVVAMTGNALMGIGRSVWPRGWMITFQSRCGSRSCRWRSNGEPTKSRKFDTNYYPAASAVADGGSAG
jgi:CheY-like chemotaxis protein